MSKLSAPWRILAGIVITAGMAWALGLPRWANQHFDQGPATPHATRVLLKMSAGKRTPPTLHTSSWTGGDPRTFAVTEDQLAAFKEGELICAWVWPGALGIEWVEFKSTDSGCE